VIRTTFLTLAILLTATAASATTVSFTATLATAVKEKIDIVAESNLFRCEGTVCKLVSKPIDAESVTTCRKLSRQVGEVTAYGPENAPFDADKLKRCNGK
jgi:hypothetical protein